MHENLQDRRRYFQFAVVCRKNARKPRKRNKADTTGGTTQDVVVFQAYIDEEGAAEWEWRKNYRVWEANRKVFLYPENFIEPELRDNKSPEFKELEDELLQQKITLESAENAYKEYLKKCTETLNLKIAGATWQEAGDYGIYHIFGHTFEDPAHSIIGN